MAHQGGKKANPRRRPSSEADVKRAKTAGQEEGLHLGFAMCLMVMKDDFNFTTDQVKYAWERMEKLSEAAAERRIKLKDLVDTLRDEYSIDLFQSKQRE